jgi:hypothetical protein
MTRNHALPEGSASEGGSIGARRVRESFNPSKDNVVDKIKRYTADLIDICEELKPLDARLASLAQTAYEEAAMWAVKAATTLK